MNKTLLALVIAAFSLAQAMESPLSTECEDETSESLPTLCKKLPKEPSEQQKTTLLNFLKNRKQTSESSFSPIKTYENAHTKHESIPLHEEQSLQTPCIVKNREESSQSSKLDKIRRDVFIGSSGSCFDADEDLSEQMASHRLHSLALSGLFSGESSQLTQDEINLLNSSSLKDVTTLAKRVIKEGNTAKLFSLLKHGIPPQLYVEGKSTLLYTAVQYDQKICISLLAVAGADLHTRDNQGNTLIHYAAQHDSDSLLSSLIKAGVNVQAKNNKGETALHKATQSNNPICLNTLIDGGVPIDSLTTEQSELPPGSTALHYAAYYGNFLWFRPLIESGTDYSPIISGNSLQSDLNYTPLELMLKYNKRKTLAKFLDVLMELEEKPLTLHEFIKVPRWLTSITQSPEIMMITKDDWEFFQQNMKLFLGAHYLKVITTQNKKHCLFRKKSIPQKVENFFKYYQNNLRKSCKTLDFETLIRLDNIAVQLGMESVYRVTQPIRQKRAHMNLSPDDTIKIGYFSLHCALDSRDLATAKCLIAHTANLDTRDNDGETPLIMAELFFGFLGYPKFFNLG